MISIMRAQRTPLEKIVFGFSILLFGLLNLVPGLFTGGAYADAQYNTGGGGSACPAGCPGGKQACCTSASSACKTQPDGTTICVTSTYYYYKN